MREIGSVDEAIDILVHEEDFQEFKLDQARQFLDAQGVSATQRTKMAKPLYLERVRLILRKGARIETYADLPACSLLPKKDREAIGRRAVEEEIERKEDLLNTDWGSLFPY